MPTRKVSGFCNHDIQNSETCWICTKVKNICDDYGLTFENMPNETAELHAITRAPTIMFFKDNAKVGVLEGNNQDDMLINKLKNLRWVE